AIAFEDAEAALKAAAPLFKDKNAARRFAAAKIVTEIGLPEGAPLMLPLLRDAEMRLVNLAVIYAKGLARSVGTDCDYDEPEGLAGRGDLWKQIESVFARLPDKQKELKPLVEGWFVPNVDKSDAADALVGCLDKRPAEKLLPYLPLMGDFARISSLAKLCAPR